jgi:hypothetical protein
LQKGIDKGISLERNREGEGVCVKPPLFFLLLPIGNRGGKGGTAPADSGKPECGSGRG